MIPITYYTLICTPEDLNTYLYVKYKRIHTHTKPKQNRKPTRKMDKDYQWVIHRRGNANDSQA